MTRIRLYANPMSRDEQMFDAPSIGDWLLTHYGPRTDMGVQIYGGEPSAETEITGDIEAIIRNDVAEYVVLQSPGSDPATWIAVISFIFSVASVLFAESPLMPNNVNRTQQSPNNALGSRQNQVRMNQRVEDIFGTVKAIPSLIMPTYNKYIKNRKYEYGYYCVTRGYAVCADVSDGDTLIANITGASAAVYQPFTSPNSGDAPSLQIGDPIIDRVLTVVRSNDVDGITLKPLNELVFADGSIYDFAPGPTGDTITQEHKAPNFNSLVNPGDQITVTMPDYSDQVMGSFAVDAESQPNGFVLSPQGGGSVGTGVSTGVVGNFIPGDVLQAVSVSQPSIDGIYTVTSVAPAFLGVTPAPPDGTAGDDAIFTVIRNYSGTYSVAGVADGFIVLTTSTFKSFITQAANLAVVSAAVPTEFTDWVTLDAAGRTEVWVNVVALNGLVKDDGGQSSCTVAYELSIEKLDPVTLAPSGVVEIVTSSLTGSVTDEVDDTLEHATAWAGPARVRMRRTTPHDYDFTGRVVDEIKWDDLYGVTPVAQTDFGNKTTVHTITQATTRSTAVKTRQLNTVASRLIPTFDGVRFTGSFDIDGRIQSGTIHASSKLIDIIAAVSADPKIGRRDIPTEVDMQQMFSVQQQLDDWDSEAGQFNYTFDTDSTSFEETVTMIANAGFCIAYRQNGLIRLALDRPQTNSTALFTHRNKKPASETITRRFAADGDFDGIEFLYSDPDTQQTETIRLPLDGGYTKLKHFELPGIRSFRQAWYRANREYAKLQAQRISIETSTTLDARALLPNARIDIVDNTKFQSFDGEVVGQSGLTLTLSQAVAFVPNEMHSMVLMRRDGSLQSIPVMPGAGAKQVVIAYPPAEAIVSVPGDIGIRTIYSIASNSARQAMAYIVSEIDLSQGMYATVRGTNYSDSFYRADTLPVPTSSTIIN